MRRLARGVLILSELISPRLDMLTAEPGPAVLEDRINNPLLSLLKSGCADCWREARPGLELDAYRIGDDSEQD